MSNTDLSHLPRSVEIPDEPATWILKQAVAKYPNNVAISFFGKELTYGEFERHVQKTMNMLRDLGVQQGEAVAMMTPNSPPGVFHLPCGLEDWGDRNPNQSPLCGAGGRASTKRRQGKNRVCAKPAHADGRALPGKNRAGKDGRYPPGRSYAVADGTSFQPEDEDRQTVGRRKL